MFFLPSQKHSFLQDPEWAEAWRINYLITSHASGFTRLPLEKRLDAERPFLPQKDDVILENESLRKKIQK